MRKKVFYLLIPLLVLLSIFDNNTSKTYNLIRMSYSGKRIERASETLTNKANLYGTSYEEGITDQMYVFYHNLSKQLDKDYDFRYVGKNVSNYAYFNCQNDDDNSTCEIWRIIGVFPVEDDIGNIKYRIKMIKNESIGNYSFNTYNNDFVNSSLDNFLNNDYFYNLSSNYQKMIGISKYYLSGSNSIIVDGESFYDIERSGIANNSVDFIGKIGLLYPSDYIFTYKDYDNNCFLNIQECENDSWMKYLINDSSWTMTPLLNGNEVYVVGNYNNFTSAVSDSLNIYPVVYLDYNVIVLDGDGSKINPYKFERMNNSDIQNEYDMLNGLDGNSDRTQLNVDDTANFKSIVLIFFSILMIIIGSLLIIKLRFKKVK